MLLKNEDLGYVKGISKTYYLYYRRHRNKRLREAALQTSRWTIARLLVSYALSAHSLAFMTRVMLKIWNQKNSVEL